jgi:hypothetical protein
MTAPHTVAGLQVGWGAIIALVNVAISGSAVAWIRARGAWLKNAQDGDEKLRDEMWRDIEKLKTSKEDTSRRLTVAETKISEQSSELGQQRFLIALMNTELERVSPGNPIAMQVRVIMEELQHRATSTHTADVGAMADALSKMCIVKGPNE